MKRPGDQYTALRNELESFSQRLATAARATAECKDSAAQPAARTLAWERSQAHLYHYRATTRGDPAQPLLIVYSLVNGAQVLDLEPGRSMIRALTSQGVDCYLLDWRDEGTVNPARSLDSYITQLLAPALEAACASSGHDALPVLGICQGGTFALCLAALAPARVRGVVSVVTPVNFHVEHDRLGGWLRALDLQRIERREAPIPGHLLAAMFRMQNPMRLGATKYLDMLGPGVANEAQDFATRVRIERWLEDAPALGPRALADFLARFYRDNALLEGTLEIAGRRVQLEALHCPLLNVYARHDRIVPAAASAALKQAAGSARYNEMVLATGHVGTFVGTRALQQVPTAVRGWMNGLGD